MKLQEEFHISTDKSLLDLELIHHFLQDAYWSKNIPIDIVEKSIENSVCFGVYNAAEQVGFARVVTDYATFAYLGDVFILEPFQGLGLAKWLIPNCRDCADGCWRPKMPNCFMKNVALCN